ncbi:MAG: cation-translocating P-type ATPase [Limnochordales bacterium]|nr:cation-translocating P-type ATPase [Limnochordales bacterium]
MGEREKLHSTVHTLSVAELAGLLHVDPQEGLSRQEVARRQREYGPNLLPEKKGPPLWALLVEQFEDFMVLVLLAATSISFLLGETADALTILAIVILNAVLGFVQEYKAERSLQALRRLHVPHCRVLREGREEIVPSAEIVPGDVIRLEAGDRVMADARLIEAFGLECDEASLTGESVPVEKTAHWIGRGDEGVGDRRNLVFMGTTVTRGTALALVYATGERTELGQVAHMLQEAGEGPTPLQVRLEQLGRWLLAAAGLTVGAVFVAGVWQGRSVYEMFLTGVSLAVAAIPEGLPAVVTITLALGVQRMIRRRAIIRRLPAVETLGCVTVICSDKTGTLTENQMTVKKLWFADGTVATVEGSGYEPVGRIHLSAHEEQTAGTLARAVEIAALCNHAEVRPDDSGSWMAVGDPTEAALLVFARKAGWPKGDAAGYRMVGEIPFESERRRMSVIVRTPAGGYRLLIKGAPDTILSRSHFVEVPGLVVAGDEMTAPICRRRPLGAGEKQRIVNASSQMAQAALRVLALAYRDLPASPATERMLRRLDPDELESGLTFVGLVGMMDPPRPQAIAAVRKARRAGIRPVMVTGDHKETALAIARAIGLDISTGAVTGQEIEAMDDRALEQIVRKVQVFARVSPRHKLRIVQALRRQGEIVAMTGDGINDAPAVREAHIGIAMGLIGTEVTKEASDMVLADDNFATIVAAVEEGRAIYENIRKSIRYLLSCNAGEVIAMFVAAVAGWPLPLLPIQILWMNLVTDGLPALALAVDPAEPGTMERPPRPPQEGVFSRGLGARILGRGLVIGLSTLAVFLWQLLASPGNLMRAQTVAFNALVFSQLLFVFQTRSERLSFFAVGVSGNPMLLLAALGSALMQLATVYWTPLAAHFHTVPLGVREWQAIFLASAWPIAFDGLIYLCRQAAAYFWLRLRPRGAQL